MNVADRGSTERLEPIMAADSKGGLGDLAGKAKEFLTDDKIDALAEKVKSVAPDSVDKHVEALAEKAKDANN